MRFSVSILLLTCIIGEALAEEGGDAAWIEATRAKYEIPGVAIAIVQLDKPTVFHASGLCNVELRIPCSEEQRLPIGSVTKAVTGLLVNSLAAGKRIDLDLPIVRYWPELRLPDDRTSQITLRDLLSHQGGLGSVDWPYFWNPTLTTQDYLDRLRFVPPARPFRSGFAYANANFVIVGKVLEAVYSSSFEDLVHKNLLKPLGMTKSGFDSPDVQTIGYGPTKNGKREPFPFVSPDAIRPAGGLVTTTKDFSRFITMLLDDGRFDGKSVAPDVAVSTFLSAGNSTKRGGYNLGLGFTHFRDQLVFHHLGSVGGYSAALVLLPHRWGAIVLTNLTGSVFPEALAFSLLDRYLGHKGDETMARLGQSSTMPHSIDVVSTSAMVFKEDAAGYVGAYRNPAWGDFVIELTKSALQIRFGPYRAPLNPANEKDHFSFLSAPGWETINITFNRNSSGNISGFAMNDGSNQALQLFSRLRNEQSRRSNE